MITWTCNSQYIWNCGLCIQPISNNCCSALLCNVLALSPSNNSLLPVHTARPVSPCLHVWACSSPDCGADIKLTLSAPACSSEPAQALTVGLPVKREGICILNMKLEGRAAGHRRHNDKYCWLALVLYLWRSYSKDLGQIGIVFFRFYTTKYSKQSKAKMGL